MARGGNEGILGKRKAGIKSVIRRNVAAGTGLPEGNIHVSRKGIKVGVKGDYAGSGLTTAEALEDVQRQADELLGDTPAGQLLNSMSLQMTIKCDGDCGAVTTVQEAAAADGFYAQTGWLCKDGWDFCPDCQKNGRMDAFLSSE